VKLGVVFPQTEIGDDPTMIRAYAQGVEAAGFDFLSAYDHVLGHRPSDPARWRELGPYTDAHAFHEVFVLFAYLAAITSRLELVTEVLVLPIRQTVLVAKQAAEIDLLSGGRLRLGIGVGWNPEESRAMGMNFRDRGKRVVEQVELLRRLWQDEIVTLHGQFHDVAEGGLKPRRRGSSIPIWIGGAAPVVLERAASIADGFMLEHSLEDAPRIIGEINRMRRERQREGQPFGFAARVHLRAEEVESAVGAARDWQEIGITHLAVETMDEGIKQPQSHLELALDFMSAWGHRT
jgi:probable F420-dependent oxidoreductase